MHGEYQANSVKQTLKKLFGLQYEKETLAAYRVKEPATTESSSESAPSESGTEESDRVDNDVKITITVTNLGIADVLSEMGFNDEAKDQFTTLVFTKGNRPELFGE